MNSIKLVVGNVLVATGFLIGILGVSVTSTIYADSVPLATKCADVTPVKIGPSYSCSGTCPIGHDPCLPHGSAQNLPPTFCKCS